MVDSDSTRRKITTDHETIRQWVETRGGTPAHVTTQSADDAGSLYVVRKDEPMDDMEAISWDDFFETFEAEELAFIYAEQDPSESDEWFYDLVERTEALERSDLDSAEVEQSLLEGEVVESEITETTVIEKTIVETDQIESQIVDSEIIETNLLEYEIQQRELVGVTFTDSEVTTTLSGETASGSGKQPHERTTDDDSMLGDDDDGILSDDDDEGMLGHEDDDSMLGDDDDGILSDEDDEQMLGDDDSSLYATDDETEPARSSADDPSTASETPAHSPVERSIETPAGLATDEHVRLDLQDSVRTKTEVFDRKTVESRVVDRDIVESDTVESDAVDIDIEGVEETILESDLIEGDLAEQAAETTTREAIPSGAITSERTEGDVIRSQFVERRVVETYSTERRQLTCEIADSQLLEAIDGRSQIIERAIVDREADEELLLSEPASVQAGTEEAESADTTAAASEQSHPADAETGVVAGGEAGASTDQRASEEEHTDHPTEAEIGKTVVSGDEEVGMVSDVQGETLYVEPHPSLTDRIKAAFEWGEADEDTNPVEADQIESITDEAVHIREV